MEEVPKIKKPRKRVKDFYPSDVIERVVFPIQNNNLSGKRRMHFLKS